MSCKTIPTVLLLFLTLCIQNGFAQKTIVAKNGTEYEVDQKISDDLNSITAPSNTVSISSKSKKKTKKKAKVVKKNVAAIQQLNKITKKRLRFRSKRNAASKGKKCFKESLKKCDSPKKAKK